MVVGLAFLNHIMANGNNMPSWHINISLWRSSHSSENSSFNRLGIIRSIADPSNQDPWRWHPDQEIVQGPHLLSHTQDSAQEMVHPNILHLLSQTQSFRPCPRSSPLSSSLSLAFSSVIRCVLFFTPYSLRQHWNGFILGAATFLGDGELPSTCLRAVALRAFRSSRSPHKRNSLSRKVSRAVDDLRRLGVRMKF